MRLFWLPLAVLTGLAFGQSYPAPAPVFSKLFGGASGTDAATALSVDGSGNVAVLGITNSPDFPVTNANQPRVTQPPLISVTAAGVAYPALSAVDISAFAASADGSVVYAASDSGIYRSADGGQTWTQQTPGLASANSIAVDGGSVNTLYAAVPPNGPARGGIYKSTDGGNTWTAVTGLFFMQFGSATLRAPSQLSGTLYGTANGFYRSADSGGTWVQIGPHTYNVFAFALAPSDPKVVYTVASDGLLYRSSDGGDTWATPGGAFTAYPNANAELYVSALAVDPQNENTVWALTLTGNLSKSTDGGATFATVLQDTKDQPTLYLSISAAGNNMIESGRGGGMASFDGGATWHSEFSGVALNAVQAENPSILGGTNVGQQGFLTKWSADGSSMIFSTYLPNVGSGGVIASDSAGNTWVASTSLTKFDSSGNQAFTQPLAPLAATAIAVDSSGNVYLAVRNDEIAYSVCGPAPNGLRPIIQKFDPQGNLLSSNPLSQLCPGTVSGLAVDASGNLYLAGSTMSSSLPTTPNAVQPTAPAAAQIGQPEPGSGMLAILSPQGSLTYLSYLGGSESVASAVAADATGNVYVTGTSIDLGLPFAPTSNFRTVSSCPANQQVQFAFAIKLNPSSPTPIWFSELGGSCNSTSAGGQVAIDTGGNVWVGGSTSSGLYPTLSPLEVQGVVPGEALGGGQGQIQGFLSQITTDGHLLLFSSYIPGNFALGQGQTLYIAGSAAPATPKLGYSGQLGVAATDALIEKVNLSAARPAVIDVISTMHPSGMDAPNRLLGVAPGEMIQILGRGLGPESPAGAQLDPSGNLATALAGTRILFDGVPAPLISVQASSIVCMTPFEVGGETTSSVQIERNGVAVPGVIVGVKPVAYVPDVLAVANADGSVNSQANPAHSGQLVTFYVTGFGATDPSVPDGSLYQAPLPIPLYSIVGYGAQIAYAGPAPGQVAGIWQINLILPQQIANPGTAQQIPLTSAYNNGGFQDVATASVWVTQ